MDGAFRIVKSLFKELFALKDVNFAVKIFFSVPIRPKSSVSVHFDSWYDKYSSRDFYKTVVQIYLFLDDLHDLVCPLDSLLVGSVCCKKFPIALP